MTSQEKASFVERALQHAPENFSVFLYVRIESLQPTWIFLEKDAEAC